MLYSFSKIWPSSKTRNASTPHGGPHHSRTYSSRSFARRVDPGKRNFTPLETTKADPFELNEIRGTERQVHVSTKINGGEGMLGKSMDRDTESTSGSEHALVEPMPSETSQQMGGIMVSKNFTVSVTQRE